MSKKDLIKLVNVIDNEDNKIKILCVTDKLTFRLEINKYDVNKNLTETNDFDLKYTIQCDE